MTSFLIGIDVGTTGSKALLIDEAGAVRASAITEYPLNAPHPLWSEQNPEEWWNATVQSTREILQAPGVDPARVAGIGLTGQMHGLVLLDAHGTVLRPSILWNDQRTAVECAEITSLIGAERVLQLTGNPVLPGFTAPKILWVRKHEPDVYRRTAKFLLPKDYVRYRLTGTYGGDVSDASGTSLFDVGKRNWSLEMLRALEIPESWVAEVAESPEVTGRVTYPAAEATGLPVGTPVVAGAGDQAAQAVGTGIVDEGVISVTIGTSGVVFAGSRSFRVEPEGRLHAFCHAVPGMWHLMGVMLSAGGSFRWYRDTIGDLEKREAQALKKDAYDLLIEPVAAVPAGSEGLLFLPYLTGERTPYPNPNARGVFFGLTIRHTKAHLTRSVMEGVTFGLRDSLELMRGLGIAAREVRASGGGARSPVWRQMMSDIFSTAITTVRVTEGAAYGAALLAGAGVGVYRSVPDACACVVKTGGTTHPQRKDSAYEELYRRYQSLYHALIDEFDAMSRLTRSA
jgi:xylulokinase